ncbi:alpha/beta hydrolase [Leptospira fletcheri]|uniref:Alpha/beta hydrolase n=1 Tax=Leptospira fletcheri TaxID=2484981 RepID=A0A4R9GID3_9LEPT|nr:alpha/beta hydrolase [Leptospira fletcheri]TGK11803.1 alpha/beta hydrolase [Leptospira fletcheri]
MLWQRLETAAARSLLAVPNEVVRIFGEDRKRERSLDPKLRTILLLAKTKPKLESLPPEKARKLFAYILNLFDFPKVELSRVENFTIPGTAGRIPVRLYSPHPTSEPLPCLVYYHGGGFVIGNLETHDLPLRYLSGLSKCAILSVDYRLAPEHPFPAAWEDAYSAYSWTRKQGKAMGLDARMVAVGGDSAGGNLAVSIYANAKKEGLTPPNFQLLLYPWLDLSQERKSVEEFAVGYGLTRDLLRYFKKHTFPNDKDCRDALANPINHTSLAGTPPTYIQIAGFDPLQDEGFAYVERLRKAKISVEAKVLEGMIHGFLNLGASVPEAKNAVVDLALWIRKRFKLKG